MADGPTIVRCYYEVLEVARTASDDELRKSYRALARVWHPDKNRGEEETARARFQEIQNAYDVLSDPDERAWYDEHRYQVLRGGVGAGAGERDEHSMDLSPFFSSSCFRGYGADAGSFFAVYSRVFDSLASEEREQGDASVAELRMPPFGHGETRWADVARFYAAWSEFVTTRSFAWVDEWDTRHAPNRQTKRFAERDNVKARARAKREFADRLRGLVDLVRKRDPRVIEHERLMAVERAKRAEDAERTRVARVAEEKARRVAAMRVYEATQAAWDAETARLKAEAGEHEVVLGVDDDVDAMDALMFGPVKPVRHTVEPDSDDDGHGDAVESGDSGNEAPGSGGVRAVQKGKSGAAAAASRVAEPEFHCAACSKTFTTAAALTSHTSSKQHRKVLQDAAKAAKPAKGAKGAKDTVVGKAAAPAATTATPAPSTPPGEREVSHAPVASASDDDTPASKRARRKRKEPGSSGPSAAPTQGSVTPSEFACNVCQAEFSTRNKLFEHIKATRHAQAR